MLWMPPCAGSQEKGENNGCHKKKLLRDLKRDVGICSLLTTTLMCKDQVFFDVIASVQSVNLRKTAVST